MKPPVFASGTVLNQVARRGHRDNHKGYKGAKDTECLSVSQAAKQSAVMYWRE